MQKSSGLCSHHCYVGTKKTEKKNGMTRTNMSMVMNEGVEIHGKAVTTKVFTVVVNQAFILDE